MSRAVFHFPDGYTKDISLSKDNEGSIFFIGRKKPFDKDFSLFRAAVPKDEQMVHMKGNGSGFPAADYGEAVFSGEESFVFQKFYQF